MGVPVRLSTLLVKRARQAAAVEERSLTEQVEHWARLGELVESALRGSSIRKLKAQSHDPKLRQRIARAHTAEGRRRAAELIRARGGPRYGVAPDDPRVVVRYDEDGTETRGRIVKGEFVPRAPRRSRK